MQLIFSFIVCHTSHLVGHLDYFRIFFLNTDYFAYPFKVYGIPHTAHQSPCLIELVFLYIILPDIFGNIPEISMKPAFKIILALFYFFLLLFLQIPLESLFPVVHHPFPDFIIGIFPFITELPLIKRTVEAIASIFVGNLLKQSLPSVFPFDLRPFQGKFHSLLFRLAFLHIVSLFLQVQPDKLAHRIVENSGTDLITQNLYPYHRIVHDGKQIGIQRFIVRFRTLSGRYIPIQHLHIKCSIISKTHRRISVYGHPHVPMQSLYEGSPHIVPPLFYLLRK